LFEGVISKKASLNIDVRIIWPNQSVHWINIRGKAYYDSAGKVNRMSGTAINIDEQKTIHQELEKAIRAREEVLAVVSHDLKNPLGAISLNADLMIRMAASDEKGRNTKDQAERIKRAAMRMERLIQDLLDVTKIESGSFHLDRHIESPAGMIHEVTELLRPLAEQRNIHLYTEIDSDSPPVTCDHNRVLQVFSNLIGNAIKFTPSGGVVSVGTIQEEDNFLKFFVRDSGPGIRPEHLDKVFNRYWQAGQTAHKGVGLGLAISQGIVYAHGGKLWVESEYGKGATFYFTLPKVASQSQLSLRL
jgi:signal transduction histidine kinase